LEHFVITRLLWNKLKPFFTFSRRNIGCSVAFD
jgi:hypothetical protein